MSKPIKVSLVLLMLGIAFCGFGVFYLKKFSEGGSQPVFAAIYLSGVVLAASGAAGTAFVSVCRSLARFKIFVASLSAVVAFAVVAAGLVSPFYMLK